MSPPANPTLVEIARTIVAAARIHDEDPLDIASGAMGSRSRWLAFAAMIEAFPDVYYRNVARWCGFMDHQLANSRSGLSAARKNKGWSWWRDPDLETVKAALARAIADSEREIDEQAATLSKATWAALAEDRATEGGVTPPLSGHGTPLPGTGGDEDRAPIQRSNGRAEGRALKGPTETPREDSHDTGSTDDGNERVEGSVTPRIEAGKVGMPAPSISQGREATRTEDLGGSVVEPVVEPGPLEYERAARVARIKAFQAGERPKVAEVMAPPPRKLSKVAQRLARDGLIPTSDFPTASEAAKIIAAPPRDLPTPPVVNAAALQNPKIDPVPQPPAPERQPAIVSPAAPALASFTRPTRALAKATPESTPRRAFDSAAFSAGHYKPDRPAAQRGCEVVTADLMGDPGPGRSALAQRQAEEAARMETRR